MNNSSNCTSDFQKFLHSDRFLTELWSEKFEWFGPSPTEHFNQLRSQPECATATSVEECDGYEQAPPYTTFLKTLESEFRCSGFSGPAVQIPNSYGNLGIGIGIFARPNSQIPVQIPNSQRLVLGCIEASKQQAGTFGPSQKRKPNFASKYSLELGSF